MSGISLCQIFSPSQAEPTEEDHSPVSDEGLKHSVRIQNQLSLNIKNQLSLFQTGVLIPEAHCFLMGVLLIFWADQCVIVSYPAGYLALPVSSH